MTFGLVLTTLVLLNGGAAGARDSRPPHPSPTTSAHLTALTTSKGAHLLPGEQIWNSGAASYDFGINDTIDYGSPNFDTLAGAGSPQAQVKAADLGLVRIWSYEGDTQAYVESKVNAAKNSGATCMVMLGETEDLAWLEKTVGWTDSYCTLYEFGNEPNYSGNNNYEFSVYTSQWLQDIPQLRAIDPTGLFGGPAIAGINASDSSIGSYPSDLAYFFAKSKAAGVEPAFVTYHDYSCENFDGGAWSPGTPADCFGWVANGNTKPCTINANQTASCPFNSSGEFAVDQSTVLGWETEYLGEQVPTGLTEWNFDAGSQSLNNWATDSNKPVDNTPCTKSEPHTYCVANNPTGMTGAEFMTDYTDIALDGIVYAQLSFATEFTSLNYSSYGLLDAFCDGAGFYGDPYCHAAGSPKPQFTAMASEVAKYKSNPLSTQVLVPSNGASLKGSAVLDASAAGPGTITGVSFDLSGGSLSKPVVLGTGVATIYGWIALWNTKTMANGTYSLQSVATETGGTTATSPKITVTVSN
jgi:hypothetical protein